ncbi:diguanylate cyclase domain-containing protein [Methylomonas sp. MgM2]
MLPSDRYLITECLSDAGWYKVYRAKCLQHGQELVLKYLCDSYPNTSMLASFRSEYQILQHLDISTVINVLALEAHGRQLVLVREFFPGLSLSEYVDRSPLPLSAVCQWISALAETLHAIHDSGVVHGNLNPQNVLIDAERKALKLIGFGHAKFNFETDTRTPSLEGNIDYLAPEQSGRIDRSVDGRTDIYALGLVFFELLTGRRPFVSDDTIGLLHKHIAQPAPDPREFNPELPESVANVTNRMLAKDPDQRYPTALALLSDIKLCHNSLATGMSVNLTSLRPALNLPDCLYGRELELDRLKTAYRRSRHDRSVLCLIGGGSGVGKSRLIDIFKRDALPDEARFVSAKCDQYQNNPPAQIFQDVFKDLLQQLLGEEQETLTTRRDRLQIQLGGEGQAIMDMLPELELVLEAQAPLPELPAAEAKVRLLRVCTAFLSAFCEPERPLCVFLDDIHWADPALFPWLEFFLFDLKHLFLIAAFRDNEIEEDSALFRMTEKLRSEGIPVESLNLAALPVNALTEMVKDTLNLGEHNAFELSKALHVKTQGNPLFFVNYLRQLQLEGCLKYCASSGRWHYDADMVRILGISENVAELLLARIASLDTEVRDALKLAACIGTTFDAELLSAVSDESDGIPKYLAKAEECGLLIVKHDKKTEFKFSHDRVQQAAYSLLTEHQLQSNRLKIGRYLRDCAHNHQDKSLLFQAVDHLNAVQALIVDAEEQRLLGADNFRLGLWAKHRGAFEQALPYFRQASDLLLRELRVFGGSATVFSHRAECEHLCGNHDQAKALFEQAVSLADSELEKARIFELMIQFYADLSRFEEAYQVSRQAAALFGIDLPAGFNPLKFGIEFSALKYRLRRFEVGDLLTLPTVADNRMDIAIRILSATLKVAYQIRPELCAAIAVKQVERCLRYGNNAEAVIGYMVFGVIFLGGVLGDHQAGYEYGRLSLGLLDKYANQRQRAEVHFVYGYFAHSWRFPAMDTETYWQTALTKGLELGDWFHSGCACCGLAQSRLMRGVALDRLWQDITEMLPTLMRIDVHEHLGVVHGIRQAIKNLRGDTASPDSFDSDDFDEKSYVRKLSSYGSRHFAHYYFVNKMMCCYLQGEYEIALEYSRLSENYLKDSAGMLHAVEHHFYKALILAKLYPNLSKLDRYLALKTMVRTEKKLSRWAKESPLNFTGRKYLIRGEIQRLRRRPALALDAYLSASREAESAGHLHLEALANEMAAMQHQASGQLRPARFHFEEAAYCYRRWGAVSCLRRFESGVMQSGELSRRRPAASTALDSVTLVKAAEAIASERKLPELLQTLMHIVIENAGAQRGALLLRDNDELLIQAEAEFGGAPAAVMRSVPLASANGVSRNVINFVSRTREIVVLENAQDSPIYGKDPEIVRRQVRSLLCAPLLLHGELQGVLYLENNLSDAVFNAERVYLLKHLSGQIAISIDNALGYRLLEDKVAERTAQLQTQKRALERKNIELQSFNDTIRALNERLRNENRERRGAELALQKANSELESLVMLDGLTQIANRRRFDQCLEIECQRVLRNKTPLALILCDIDYFKAYNDCYGHLGGDDCLKAVAQAIAGALRRTTDIAARYGGEEFAVIMPHTDEEGATQVAGRVRQAVMDLNIPHQGSQVAQIVTVSIGVATAIPFRRCAPASLIKTADEALYLVKEGGRNGIHRKMVA